jgi:hypothetical protein
MSRLQEGEEEGERSKLKIKRQQLVKDDSGSIGVVRNEDSSFGQFKRPPFEGLSRTAIPIERIPQPQYDNSDTVTRPTDHSPDLAPSAPTKYPLAKSLQEGEQEGEGFPGQVKRIGPLQEGEESEATEPEGSDDTDIDDLEPSPDKPVKKRRA